jgi:hypothetical protein
MAEHHWIHTEGTVVEAWPLGGGTGLPTILDGREESFRDLMAEGVDRHGVDLYLYSVVGRRFHLLFSAVGAQATAFAHDLGSAFADHQTEGRGKKNHRLALRYRSIRGEKEACLFALSRSLHLFPFRARVVSSPEEYGWSSYRSYIGKEEVPAWLSRDRILGRYRTGIEEAQRRYRSDVEGLRLQPGSAGALEDLLASVRRYYRIPSIETGGKEVYPITLRAREMFVWLARAQVGAGSREIAARSGHPLQSAVPRQLRRTAGRLELDSAFRSQWQREAAAIMRLRPDRTT